MVKNGVSPLEKEGEVEVLMADVKGAYVLRDWLNGRINGIRAPMLLG